ncbi:TPA: hypothetical protein I7753_18760 [Vibrio vulnificus]|uniref:Uncharacterized protein n=1 Tax=Vibrio vulnificus TaxID=672 RepID=A0ABX4X0J4_VIBVL|nr:hypothetical protein [Vibrio vulnificus]ELC9583374.1 hypothetical protein [Vibrio vulnificus]ELQ2457280.1 hypothetical protein [Vibrio vulnificus]PNM76929.1 hypothetical protein AL548_007375 [Vibrio vulnificus]POC44691.1 hypothetical protein CRN48_13855 [Vibrio vulnificus]
MEHSRSRVRVLAKDNILYLDECQRHLYPTQHPSPTPVKRLLVTPNDKEAFSISISISKTSQRGV